MKPRAKSFGVCLIAVAVSGWLPGSLDAVEQPSRRIVAVGDVHGSREGLQAILQTAGVVDAAGNWADSDAVLVQTGDFTDRGTEVKSVMDFLRHLEASAAEEGARLISLLGNHEIYNLVGFFDYQSTPLAAFTEIAADFADEMSEKRRKQAYKTWRAWARRYGGCGPASRDEWMARHPPGFLEYQEALSPKGEYGQWLRRRKVVAEIDGTIFLHGGLSPELLDMGLESLEAINAAAASELRQFDEDRAVMENEHVVLPFSTLGEIHCAMAYEVLTKPEGSLSPGAVVRKRRLREIYQRLPSTRNWLLLDAAGPVWFRGYARWTDEEAEAGLATVFGTFGGSRVVVGHTPQVGNIRSRFDGRVFLIDTAMAYADVSSGRPAALEIVGDEVFAIYQGERLSLMTEVATPEEANGSR